VVAHYQENIKQLPQDWETETLKIGIIGEIYVVTQPFANQNLEVELGRLGVEVRRTRSTFLSEYVRFSTYLNVLSNEKKKPSGLARPYMKRDVGGHGQESVAEKVLLAREGFDGLVHVMPFTCMPEVMAQNILPLTKEDIPVLTVICDEQMAQPALRTRLEAFTDLLRRRRRIQYGRL
jgi:predicted nucleotide-binding protein (sugar kinase/HSP70/actin superfamily)